MELMTQIANANASHLRDYHGPDDEVPLNIYAHDEATGGRSADPVVIPVYDDATLDVKEKNFRFVPIERNFDGIGDDFYSSGKVLFLKETTVSEDIIAAAIEFECGTWRYKPQQKVFPQLERGDWRILLTPIERN